MNYLQLCQDLSLEADIAGGTAVPTTVSSQTGELNRLVTWVKDAYIDIQNRHQWRWLKREFEITTTSGVDTYAYSDTASVQDTTDADADITRFYSWYLQDPTDPPRIHLDSAGVGAQTFMTSTDWPNFRLLYRIGTQVDAAPNFIAVDPQNKIVIGPGPNDVYKIRGQYIRGPQVLTDDEDIPEMPSQYHKLIVYKALEKYGWFESATEVIQRAQKEGSRMMRQLENNQHPRMRVSGPMA